MILGAMTGVALTLTNGFGAQTAQQAASATPPDFSGVYYPANEGRGGAGRKRDPAGFFGRLLPGE